MFRLVGFEIFESGIQIVGPAENCGFGEPNFIAYWGRRFYPYELCQTENRQAQRGYPGDDGKL